MLIKSSNFKIFLAVFALYLSACSNSTQISQSNNQPKTRGISIAVTPTPLLGRAAKIKGEYAPMKIMENLKDSVEQQELPKVWLEFEKENGEIQRVELNDKFQKKLNTAGKLLFNYQYVINNSENPNERFDAAFNQAMGSINARHEMENLEIDLPNEKRKLTEEEINQLFSKQAGLINDRYFELDDHFKPKSAFYNFKKSVNEKLGYQIF